MVAACRAMLDQAQPADIHRLETLKLQPEFTVAAHVAPTLRYQHAEYREHHRAALLKAGFAD
jgi:hypothetical protein